jgi:DNA-binding MarR family transcriptional regulator
MRRPDERDLSPTVGGALAPHGNPMSVQGVSVLAERMRCLLEAARAIVQRIDSELLHLGLTCSQFYGLTVLVGSKAKTPSECARLLHIGTGGVTRLFDRLEGSGLIVRMPGTEDRRRILLELTPKGRSVYSQASRLVRQTQERWRLDMPDEDIEMLCRLLARLSRDMKVEAGAQPMRDSGRGAHESRE